MGTLKEDMAVLIERTGHMQVDLTEVKERATRIEEKVFDHVANHLNSSRFSRNEKVLGLGGGTGVVGLIAYAILQQIGWLPVG